MAKKAALLGGAQIKVENMSGFDKSRFNAFTAPLGAIVPMLKQLMLPGNFNLKLKISAQLPPLATDAFLRTHLKVECFAVPLRLCYGGFESWFSGSEIQTYTESGFGFGRAKLPRLKIDHTPIDPDDAASDAEYAAHLDKIYGVHTLMDYFNVKYELSVGKVSASHFPAIEEDYFNIFPFIAYQLCYHHWYRNKLIERPLFAPPSATSMGISTASLSSLPYISCENIMDYGVTVAEHDIMAVGRGYQLLNGDIFELRKRNYGFDYFTTALPSAQEGSPMSVDTSSGSFTISALRAQNAMQHFVEVNQLASPDMVQTNKARYGVDLSAGVAQKPILLGSTDFPMFSSGVEQTAGNAQETSNPFAGVAARYGRAHAEGSDFICEGKIMEPSYLMLMFSLVPEANYAHGVAHDMRIFTQEGSLVDLPVGMLEGTGYEPILQEEVYVDYQGVPTDVFGYQPRYMWHKAGALNEVHGLFRAGASLASFIPQRDFEPGSEPSISSWFLKVEPTDLDNVMAVSGELSKYGVMVDSSIELFVSEPLGESVLPSLVNPAEEHGRAVYVSRGAQTI